MLSCQIFGGTEVYIRQFPSDEWVVNQIALITVTVLTIFPTIILNAVSVITIMKSTQLKSKMCYFIILIQSVADLVVGAIGIPLSIVVLFTGIGELANCMLATAAYKLLILLLAASMLTLSVLTTDRYVAVLHPYAYSTQLTRRRILIYLSSGVMLLFLLFVLSDFFHGIISHTTTLVATVFFAWTAFVYTRIYLVVRKFSRSDKQVTFSHAPNALTRKKIFLQEVKQAKDCFIVVICFFLLCYVPVTLTFTLLNLQNRFVFEISKNWTTALNISNCILNSVIFFWTKTLLRKKALKMLRSFCSCRSH